MRIFRLLAFPMVLGVAACSSYGGIDPLKSDPDLGIQNSAAPVELQEGSDPVDDDMVKSDSAFNNNEIAFEMILDLAGYKPEQLAGVVPDLVDIIVESATGSPEELDKGEFFTFDSHYGEITEQTNRTRYQCSGGGTMIHEVGEIKKYDTWNRHNREVNSYDFNECLFDVSNGRVVEGAYSANGVLFTSKGYRSGSGLGAEYTAAEWTTFDLEGPDSLRYEVDGSSSFKYMGTCENSFSSSQSDFNYYRKTESSEITNQMIGSRFQMGTIDDIPDRSIATLRLDFSGSFEDSRSARQLISVNTDTSPLVSVGLAEEQLTPKGQITVQSSDGGVMTLVVKGSNEGFNPNQILVDWTNISADGITTSDTDILLGSYNIANEPCKLVSNETPLVCKNGNFRYTLP